MLHNNDEYTNNTSLKTYFSNVYEYIMVLFENLKDLIFVASSINEYPPGLVAIRPEDIGKYRIL